MIDRYLAALFLAIFLLIFPGKIGAQNNKEKQPVNLSEQFDAWVIICAEQGESEGPKCRMLQSQKIGKTAQDILAISLIYDVKVKSGFGVFSLPNGVYLAPDIRVQVDARRPFRVLYEYCGNSGCHAGFKLSGNVLRAFRRGSIAKTRVWFGVNEAVDVDISLKGFAAAFKRLEELSS